MSSTRRGNKYLEAMAGLWCASLGFSEKRLADAGATGSCLSCPTIIRFLLKSNVPSVELADPPSVHRAHADVEGDVPVLGLGSQRHGDQARLVLTTTRSAGRKRRRSSGACAAITAPRSPASAHPASRICRAISTCRCRCSGTPTIRTTTVSRRRRRERGAVLRPHGRQPREADPCRRARDGRGVLRRTGAGGGAGPSRRRQAISSASSRS